MVKLQILIIAILLGRHRTMLAGVLLGSSLIVGSAQASQLFAKAQTAPQASQRMHDLRGLIEQARSLSAEQALQRVNEFFNNRIQYGEDQQVWAQADYWASPLETLERGAGDCEDFALAKYFTLRLIGIPEQNLRLVYTTLGANQAHMVLGYWSDDAAAPLLLDNLLPEILPVAQRQDLQVQFAFDREHLYRFDEGLLIVVGDAGLLPGWLALKARVAREQLSPAIAMPLVTTELLRAKPGA